MHNGMVRVEMGILTYAPRKATFLWLQALSFAFMFLIFPPEAASKVYRTEGVWAGFYNITKYIKDNKVHKSRACQIKGMYHI